MIDLSIARITRIAIAMGVAGVLIVFAMRGVRDATGFLVGAVLSLISIRSWFKLAGAIGASDELPGAGAVAFLILRYGLIAGAVYVMINVLHSSPGILILGLLVSFAAVLVELAFGQMASKQKTL
ncbi:MAG: hypothetical protein EXQ47_11150 [Bryobacterales bacterium]|nr:hypothetical protein [Bryobacterales bacterium]